MTPDANDLCVFAVKRGYIESKESFAYLEDSNLIVFLDCGNEHRIEEEISAIYKAHTEDGLSIVDLEARIPGKGYKAYHVDKECKLSIICFDEHINVDQPSNQQKRFFTKEKFDEKFQKRIDYFSKVAMSFFANHGYDTEGFTINPYMVVNKVFRRITNMYSSR